MEKEILLESDLDEVSGGGYVLMLSKKQYDAIKEAGFIRLGRIDQNDIPGIQAYLKDIGYTDSLNIRYTQ